MNKMSDKNVIGKFIEWMVIRYGFVGIFVLYMIVVFMIWCMFSVIIYLC